MSILKYFSEQKETMEIIKTKFPIGWWLSSNFYSARNLRLASLLTLSYDVSFHVSYVTLRGWTNILNISLIFVKTERKS